MAYPVSYVCPAVLLKKKRKDKHKDQKQSTEDNSKEFTKIRAINNQ